MTAAELIQVLQSVRPDTPVLLWDAEYMQYNHAVDSRLVKIGIRYNGNRQRKEYPVLEDHDFDRHSESFTALIITDTEL